MYNIRNKGMNILVIGQCTLHWGRMEFGNIGNYYIMEPFFRELHRVFPSAKIMTTFQMSDRFCYNEDVVCLPMNLYYAWEKEDLDKAYKEMAIATIYFETNNLIEKTPFIEAVLDSDLVIDFSGDIWGRNADLVGPNRFLVGLLKDRVVQLLGKPIVMMAGSPGPFNRDETLDFAHKVFANFTFVTNREKKSREILQDFGFDVSNVKDFACPAFMFEPSLQKDVLHFIENTPLQSKGKPTIGFVLCGWNMLEGPFSREDWREEEFDVYVKALVNFIEKNDVNVCLMSHSNGFDLPPQFKLKQGRDFVVVKKLYDILQKTDVSKSVFLLDGLYSPAETKAIISNFDMLISGRVHAAVAGLSQNIPTVIIDYGHEPKAHKLIGFADIAGVCEYVANPASLTDLEDKMERCWNNRVFLQHFLLERNIIIKEKIKEQFDLLKEIFEIKDK